ncbi:hypothetical protein LCM20_03105 [Halobacillus litoralis]|uniref:hypothetical protein n=1 Tax=Halobacillus litoralis TaxID=45668 RepID=UPI001CD28993|nr:hypothetical protein [Halobacillus litoralis]MCA0969579.1 hypothetical protein [Halobacillus litoralis]
MKLINVLTGVALVLIICLFHLFALMDLFPLYVTSPLLFISIYYVIASLFYKKTFKGFTK